MNVSLARNYASGSGTTLEIIERSVESSKGNFMPKTLRNTGHQKNEQGLMNWQISETHNFVTLFIKSMVASVFAVMRIILCSLPLTILIMMVIYIGEASGTVSELDYISNSLTERALIVQYNSSAITAISGNTATKASALTRKAQRPSLNESRGKYPEAHRTLKGVMIWSDLVSNYKPSSNDEYGLTNHTEHKCDICMMNQLSGNTNISDTKYTGNNATVAPDSSHWILATGVAGTDAEASLSSASTLSLSLIDKAVVKAKTLTPKIRPLKVNGEDKYVMFIHPYAHYQLRAGTATGQYMDIQKAAIMGGQISKNPIYTGALGEYGGVILHESTRVPWGTEAANTIHPKCFTGTASVARNVFCGAQAAVLCTGRNTSAGLDATWSEELFDYDNQLGIAASLIFGIKKAIFNSTDFATIAVSTFSPAP